eukprot:c1007_g1_i1.p1 GENE.c1007_g1_i1~~c1007_g1_i1.p1  ORF type:complete len:502 (-),score=102.59 c1007_g1_i1:45-1550(-)
MRVTTAILLSLAVASALRSPNQDSLLPEQPSDNGVSSSKSLLQKMFDRLVSQRTASLGDSDPLDIYRTPGCPFASWFSALPSKFGLWESELETKYDMAWRGKCQNPGALPSNPDDPAYNPISAGCPTGFDKNDHNYNTALGQGNSLGVVAGNLEIYNLTQKGHPELAIGLFKTPQVIPVIARASDFGDDTSSLRLTRLALKIPYPQMAQDQVLGCTGHDAANDTMHPGSWYGEMNMLLTETMDTFPLANYDDIAKFSNDPDSGAWSTLVMSYHVLEVLARNGWNIYKASDDGVLAKSYFSQLPYMLGCGKAFKFAFYPMQAPCSSLAGKDQACCVPVSGNTKQQLAQGLANYLSSCDAVFEMRVQVLDTEKNWDLINKNAQTRWSSSYVPVGRLTIPKQNCSSTTGTSLPLQAALGQELGMSPSDTNLDGIHKLLMFHALLTPTEHRPLGEVNSFRSHFYSLHTGNRLETIQWDAAHPDRVPPPPFKVPTSIWNNTELFGF